MQKNLEPQGERNIPPQSGPGRFSRFFRLFSVFSTNKRRPKRSFSIKNTHAMHVFDQGGSFVDHFGTHLLPVCFLHIHSFQCDTNSCSTFLGLFLGPLNKLKHAITLIFCQKHSFQARFWHGWIICGSMVHPPIGFMFFTIHSLQGDYGS